MNNDLNQKHERLISFLAQDPNNLNLLLDIYTNLRDEGSFEQAKNYLERIKLLDADLARAHEAELCFMLGEHEKAHELFVMDLQYHDSPQSRFALAINLYYLKRFDEALEYVSTIEDDKLTHEHLSFIGRCYFQLGKYQQAFDALEQCLSYQPNDPHALGLSALICLDMGRFDEALKKANQALELNNGVYEARLVQLYFSNNYTNKEFLTEINALLQIQPDDSRLWHFLGLHYFETLEFKQAETVFIKTLELHPNFSIVYINLGLCYLLQSRESEAMTCFQKLSKTSDLQGEGYGGIALVLALQGDYSNAKDNLHMAKSIDPSSFLMLLAEIIILNHESPEQAYQRFHQVFADRVSVLIPVFEKLLAERSAAQTIH